MARFWAMILLEIFRIALFRAQGLETVSGIKVAPRGHELNPSPNLPTCFRATTPAPADDSLPDKGFSTWCCSPRISV